MRAPALLLALLSAVLPSTRATGEEGSAETIFLNGRFYTADDQRPWAEAVAVRGGRFVRVGGTAEVRALARPGTRLVDLRGRLVLPGLVDAHTHPSLEARYPYQPWPGFPFAQLRRKLSRFPAPEWVRVRALADSTRILSAYGFTAFGDGRTRLDQLGAWEALIRQGGLHQHAVLFVPVRVDSGLPAPTRPAQLREELARHRLPGVGFGAKLFVDGYLQGETASLEEPYEPPGGGRGRLATPVAELEREVEELDHAGIPMQLHAIGDHAVRTALDALARAVAARGGRPGPQHAIIHARLVREEDLPRFGRLGVAAVLDAFLAQPSPEDGITPEIGPERRDERYLAFRKLVDAGALVGACSDWPSASMNPFHAMYAAVTRRSPGHPERGTLGPANAVPLERMIRAYTIDNARVLGIAGEAGSITAGKWADLVVLDRDILRRPIEELPDTRVVATVFEGRTVYDGSALPWYLARSEARLLEIGNGR